MTEKLLEAFLTLCVEIVMCRIEEKKQEEQEEKKKKKKKKKEKELYSVMQAYGILALIYNLQVGVAVLGRRSSSCICTSAFLLPAKEADP